MKNNKILIIAEAGVNHNGKIFLAKKLIDIAKNSGADIVKFQTFKADKIVTEKALKAKYQIKKNDKITTQFQMLKKLEFSYEDFIVLKKYCEKKKIEFLSTPFDIESLNILKKLKVKKIKIASGEITNYPLLKAIGSLNLLTIMSTGMSTIKEINSAIKILTKNGLSKKNLILLHCTTDYPTKLQDVNLKVLTTFKNKFKLKFGYSDHTLGSDVSIAAAGLGASVIEKHITINNNMIGPDHKASADQKNFKSFVKSIRNIEIALGTKNKTISKNELTNIKSIRKSICASRPIKKGEIFTEKNITSKRPGVGKSPMLWNKILKTRAKKNYNEDDFI